MTVCCELTVDRTAQIETVDDCSGSEINELGDQFRDLFLIDLCCAEGIDQNGNGLCNTDCVCKLNLTLIGKTCGYDILCNISCSICSGTVNLCRVLARECAAAVTGITTVCINDDLSAGQTGITLRTADNKTAGGVDKDICIFIQKFRGDDGLDNVFNDVCTDLLKRHIRIMLG